MSGIDQSAVRRKRAVVARVLLSIHESGQLDRPEQWTWEALDALPAWCLLEADARRRLQAICGALAIAPALQRWIDGQSIAAAHRLIGEALFEHIVASGDAASLPFSAPAPVTGTDAERLLMQAGAAVLFGTLDACLPAETLAADLGEPLGELDGETAQLFLALAEQLQASHGKFEHVASDPPPLEDAEAQAEPA